MTRVDEVAVANISASVGRGGANRPVDVATIQNLLNRRTGARLRADGVCGQKTIAAILGFQKTFLSTPDGRVDPNGSSWHRLLKAATALELLQLPQISGHGYYSYSSADRQFGTVDTIQAISDVASSFCFNMPRIQIGIGDISFEHGGQMSPHVSHRKGLQVDIRPLRTDMMHLPCDYRDHVYSREYTRLLAQSFLAHRNVKRILFNDSRIHGVHPFAGHDNHMHVEMHK
jgi:hypothetical protein